MPEEPFAAFVVRHKPRINHRLTAILKQQRERATELDASYGDIWRQIQQLMGRGGKRLRPLLSILAYEGYGGRRAAAMLQAAVSQELLHAFLLMHDDIIDRDLRRWNGPNITGVYFERYSRSMMSHDALHFAEAQALLAGDTCLSLSNQLLATAEFPAEARLQALQLQQTVMQQVVAGEIIETTFAQEPELDEADVLQMYRYKTASYSFGLPLSTGALFAGAPTAELKRISNLADNLGIAFQLQDDILGVFGDELVTGKSNHGDLREGKRTVLIITALKLTAESDRKKLLKILGKADATDGQIDVARRIVVESGARAYVQQQAKRYAGIARTQVDKLALNGTAKARLHDLIDLLITRNN